MFVFSGIFVKAQSQQMSIDVWPGKVPGELKEKRVAVKDMKTEPGVIRFTEVTNPTLAVYPPKGKANGVGVIVCPGGGYGILAYDKEGTDIAKWLTSQGFTAFVLAYRVPGKPDGALQDIQRAVRVVRQKYSDNGIHTIGAIGFSAGASLSARAATRFAEELYSHVDVADQLSCRLDFALLIYPAYLDGGPNRSLTPELKLSAETPPMFLFATADDAYANSALVMAQALRDHKIPVELHLIPKGGHGYGMRSGAGLRWPSLAEAWLKQFVKKK